MTMRVGIDFGSTTTKVAGLGADGTLAFHVCAEHGYSVTPEGALAGFLERNALSRAEVSSVTVTGIRAPDCGKTPPALPCRRVEEFQAIGRGGLYLSGLKQAVVVSMGTGTAVVRATVRECLHLGGTGVGGGTLLGLAARLIGARDLPAILELAGNGNLANVDLLVGDLSSHPPSSLHAHLTASNFGRLNEKATRADYALGLLNLVFQTVGVVSVFAAARFHEHNVVLTGLLSTVPQARDLFSPFALIAPLRFLFPPHGQYATAVGAALLA